MKGAQELIINEANKLNESKAEIQHLKEALETQVGLSITVHVIGLNCRCGKCKQL